mmetsp:Transcript_8337/g.16990  ORF Transcript_8337/g.16990 Transcript_8337/m.16990 type:complete len:202 (+) Transcript_8337:1001-1606(+)
MEPWQDSWVAKLDETLALFVQTIEKVQGYHERTWSLIRAAGQVEERLKVRGYSGWLDWHLDMEEDCGRRSLEDKFVSAHVRRREELLRDAQVECAASNRRVEDLKQALRALEGITVQWGIPTSKWDCSMPVARCIRASLATLRDIVNELEGSQRETSVGLGGSDPVASLVDKVTRLSNLPRSKGWDELELEMYLFRMRDSL